MGFGFQIRDREQGREGAGSVEWNDRAGDAREHRIRERDASVGDRDGVGTREDVREARADTTADS